MTRKFIKTFRIINLGVGYGKITVLTPVHISSGNVYLSILIHDNKRYELMDILQTSSDPKRFLDNNLNNMLLRDNITVSKKQFFDALNLEPRKLDQKTPLYKINNKTEKQIIDGNISESVKNLSAPYIPGSTLKAMFQILCGMIFYRKSRN